MASSGSNEALTALYRESLRVAHAEASKAHGGASALEHMTCISNAAASVLGLSADQAAQAAQAKSRPVRAYLDGCFDIMHSGHYNAIRQAKMTCDILVVGVHSNAEITLHKGPPVMSDEERLAMVKACKWVDEVAFDTPYSPTIELLDKLRCDYAVHGDDTAVSANGEDAYSVMKKMGRMKIIKRTEGVSTTDLVGRLLLMTKSHHVPEPVLSLSPSVSAQMPPPDAPVLALDSAAGAVVPVVKVTAAPAAQRAQLDSTFGAASSAGMSTFLPTTWRISQFSSHRVPKPDDVIVYVDGAFDLFHVAHVEFLERARALGTFLYVGVHSDETVNRHKGRNYPIMNVHERVLNVLSCKFVDEVVIGAPWEVSADLLRTLNVALVVSGKVSKLDHDIDDGTVDPYDVPKKLGIFRVVDTTRHLSTENVVQRIIENRMAYEARNKKRGKKEADYLATREYVQEV